MTAEQQVEYIVDDCFFAVGQIVGRSKSIEYDAVVWLRSRYRAMFLHAMTTTGTAWDRDRDRVTAVGRYLGQRALHHAGDSESIGVPAMAQAAADVERGCRMNAEREGVLPASGP